MRIPTLLFLGESGYLYDCSFLRFSESFPEELEVIGETHGGCTVAEMLTGNIVESAFQGKMLANVLIYAHLGIEIGWRIGWCKRVAAGAPDHIDVRRQPAGNDNCGASLNIAKLLYLLVLEFIPSSPPKISAFSQK